MKHTPTPISRTALLIAFSCMPLQAQFFWDGNDSSVDNVVDGGSGIWSSTNTNWTNALGNSNFVWQDGNKAIFSSTGGTVTLADGFTAAPNELEFGVDGYILGATGSGRLQFNSGSTAITLGAGVEAEISAPITGAGGLAVQGASDSILYLSGENDFQGGTIVHGGTLAMGNFSDTGSITGDIATAASTTVAFFRTNDHTYSGSISGLGGLLVSGGGHITLTGSQTYTGGTILDASGRLILGSGVHIDGMTTVQSGLLGGIGSAQQVALGSEGIIAPGMINSIGSFSTETLGMQTGSITEIDIAGTTPGSLHDQLLVGGGGAQVNGTLHVKVAEGYVPGEDDTFDFLIAGGSITGAYDQITSNNNLLGFLVSQETGIGAFSNILRLTAFSTAFEPRVFSPNAIVMARAIDNERRVDPGDFTPYVNHWLGLSDSDLDRAMLAISPDRMSSMLRGSLHLMQAAHIRFGNHMAMLRHNGITPVVRQQVKSSGKDTLIEMDPARYGGWFEGSGGFADFDSLGHSIESGEAQAGLDYQLRPGLIAGVFTGYHDSEIDLGTLGSEIGIRGGSLGAYTLYQPHGSTFYYQGMTSIGFNNYDTRRNFIAGPDFFNARGDTSGLQYNLNGTVGWQRDLGTWQLSTEATLRYAAVEVDDYTETGASPFDIAYQDENAESLQSVLTTRISRNHRLWAFHAFTELRVSWRHEYLTQTLTTTGSFVSGGGIPFTVGSPNLNRNTAELGIGTTLLLDAHRSLALNYDTQISGDFSSHYVSAMLRYEW